MSLWKDFPYSFGSFSAGLSGVTSDPDIGGTHELEPPKMNLVQVQGQGQGSGAKSLLPWNQEKQFHGLTAEHNLIRFYISLHFTALEEGSDSCHKKWEGNKR